MKIVESEVRQVEMGGGGESRAITISSNGTIIRNTIKGIYAHKERTVTRELMANAFDAHIAGGVEDTPIKVFLPTLLDPVFSVRDYGCGMSHDFVMEHYSSLGFSTKSDSNTETGMFGVGSKSPLAISDSFSLRCFDQPTDEYPAGRVRMYTLFFDTDGSPRLQHTFDSSPRDEDEISRGGTEVRVPVSAAHRDAIISGLAQQQFAWFDKPVVFDGAVAAAEGQLFSAISKLADGVYLGSLKTSRRHAPLSGRVFVRQGSAVYPLDADKLNGDDTVSQAEIVQRLNALTGNTRHLMIDLPIGTADVTMAREALQYNEMTINNLSTRVREALLRVTTLLNETIDETCYTYPRALEAIAGVMYPSDEDISFAQLSALSDLLPIVKRRVENYYDAYHAELPKRTITEESIADDGSTLITELEIDPPYYMPRLRERLSAEDLAMGKALFATGKLYRDYSKSPTISITTGLSAAEFTFPTIIYVLPSHLYKWQERVEAHVRKFFADFLLPDYSGDALNVIIIRTGKKSIDLVKDNLTRRGKIMLYFSTDDLPEVARDSAPTSTYSKTAVYQWEGRGWSSSKVEPDYTEPAYYLTRVQLTTDCYGIAGPDMVVPAGATLTARRDLSESSVNEAITSMRRLKLIDERPIYRVTLAQRARLVESAGAPLWEPLLEPHYQTIESKVQPAPLLAISKSTILANYDMRSLENMLRALNKKEHDADLTGLFRLLVEIDPLFAHLITAWCTVSYGSSTPAPSAFASTLPAMDDVHEQWGKLARAVFGIGQVDDVVTDQKNVYAWSRLTDYLRNKYRILVKTGEAPSADYVVAMINGVRAAKLPYGSSYTATLNAGDLAIIATFNPFVESFQTFLDGKEKAWNDAKTADYSDDTDDTSSPLAQAAAV